MEGFVSISGQGSHPWAKQQLCELPVFLAYASQDQDDADKFLGAAPHEIGGNKVLAVFLKTLL